MFSWLTDPQIVATLTTWLGALCTLGIYSVLYRENKVFRVFEHLFLGLATGYTIATTWNDILKPRWWKPMVDEGRWWFLFAVPASLLFYMVYSKRHNWMSRVIFGFFFGAAAGQSFQAFASLYFPQIQATVNVRFIDPPEAQAPDAYALTPFSAALNNLLGLAILASVMTYFLFSFEQKGKVVPAVSRFGRYVLMFAFGSIFGSTIMARMSLLIGRMYFLIHDWVQVTILRQAG